MKEKKLLIGAGVVLCVGLLSLLVWFLLEGQKVEESTTISFERGEEVSEWAFEGSYASTPHRMQAEEEIAKLEALLGGGEYEDYDILIGIAGQYELLGDGARAFNYLEQAILLDDSEGLAFHNLGHLLTRLGAVKTARTAFFHAVEKEPVFAQYHIAYLTHLVQYFETDTEAIEHAYSFARESVAHSEIHIVYARYLARENRIEEAIAAWREARTLVTNLEAVDREIAKLEARL